MESRTEREPEYVIRVGRMGMGTARTVAEACERAREAALEEALWTGTVYWTVLDPEGRVVADGIATR
ncbi:hypothetical protein HRbin12_01328 [bacterium HR12]|nr:hypothetical protein HRbin12_01328 [bacterium HR12]